MDMGLKRAVSTIWWDAKAPIRWRRAYRALPSDHPTRKKVRRGGLFWFFGVYLPWVLMDPAEAAPPWRTFHAAYDSHGVPASNYTVNYDNGSIGSPVTAAFAALVNMMWEIYSVFVMIAAWMFDFIFQFKFLGIFRDPVAVVAGYIEETIETIGIIPVMGLLGVVIAAITILKGQTGRGLADMGITLFIAAFLGTVFANPVDMLADPETGAIVRAQEMGSLITADSLNDPMLLDAMKEKGSGSGADYDARGVIYSENYQKAAESNAKMAEMAMRQVHSLEGNPYTPRFNPAKLAREMAVDKDGEPSDIARQYGSRAIVDVFMRTPHQILNLGRTIDGVESPACVAVYDTMVVTGQYPGKFVREEVVKARWNAVDEAAKKGAEALDKGLGGFISDGAYAVVENATPLGLGYKAASSALDKLKGGGEAPTVLPPQWPTVDTDPACSADVKGSFKESFANPQSASVGAFFLILCAGALLFFFLALGIAVMWLTVICMWEAMKFFLTLVRALIPGEARSELYGSAMTLIFSLLTLVFVTGSVGLVLNMTRAFMTTDTLTQPFQKFIMVALVLVVAGVILVKQTAQAKRRGKRAGESLNRGTRSTSPQPLGGGGAGSVNGAVRMAGSTVQSRMRTRSMMKSLGKAGVMTAATVATGGVGGAAAGAAGAAGKLATLKNGIGKAKKVARAGGKAAKTVAAYTVGAPVTYPRTAKKISAAAAARKKAMTERKEQFAAGLRDRAERVENYANEWTTNVGAFGRFVGRGLRTIGGAGHAGVLNRPEVTVDRDRPLPDVSDAKPRPLPRSEEQRAQASERMHTNNPATYKARVNKQTNVPKPKSSPTTKKSTSASTSNQNPPPVKRSRPNASGAKPSGKSNAASLRTQMEQARKYRTKPGDMG